MARGDGTFEATALRTRQWIGLQVAVWAMFLTFFGALFASALLFLMVTGSVSASQISEKVWFLAAWAHGEVGPFMAYAYPPILLGVGLLLFAFSMPLVNPVRAILKANGQSWGARSIKLRARGPARHLKEQLHERGLAGLFWPRMILRLGLGFVGASLVLVTALFAPTMITAGGQTQSIPNMDEGLLPTVCLVASLIALGGLLLAFPYGGGEKVVVDTLGNLRGAGEPSVLSPIPPAPLPSAPLV